MSNYRSKYFSKNKGVILAHSTSIATSILVPKKQSPTIVAVDANAATRQARGGAAPLPRGGPRRGRQLLVRGLPLPHTQGDPRAAIALGRCRPWRVFQCSVSCSEVELWSGLVALWSSRREFRSVLLSSTHYGFRSV